RTNVATHPCPTRRSSDLTKGATRIIAGQVINTLTDQLGYQQPAPHFLQHGIQIVLGTSQTRTQQEVVRATGIPCGRHAQLATGVDRKSTRLNSSHVKSSY